MAQDESTSQRAERIAKALESHFDEARHQLARQFALAQDGWLIEQTEMPIFEELNRLKTKAQEIGLQERIKEAEAAFSPSGPTRKAARQGNRRQ